MRIGAALCALWLALPNRREDIAWPRIGAAALIGLGLIFLAARPRVFLAVAPTIAVVALVLYVLRLAARPK
jgi:hypothetical protein